MMYTNRMFQKLIVGGAFFLALTATVANAQTPSGSMALETPAGSSGLETLWTGCRLLFQGKAHECSLTGLQVPETGTARVAGAVYDLKEIGNFAGTYKAVGDDFALGAGHLTVKNEKGVRIVLSAFGELVELKVADKGIAMQLKK